MRISSLPSLAACPGWWLLRKREDAGDGDRRPKPAADTGSAAGRAIQLYHEGHPRREAIALAEQEAPARFPAADLARMRRLADAYMRDPNNPPEIATDLEREVVLDLADADGAPLRLVGHVDQVRNGKVYDIKAGQAHDGRAMLSVHALQLAAYAVAGGWEPGGILRLAGYEDGGAIRFECPWDAATARALLEVTRRDVADLRAGRVLVRPGNFCSWCPASNVGACLARFRAEPPRREEVE